MKFLVDMPLSPSLAEWLNGRGHKAVHAYEVGLGKATDAEILRKAAKEERVVITCDLDFPQRLALSGEKNQGLILLRGGNYSSAQAIEILERVFSTIPEQQWMGSLIVVDQHRLRRIPLPLKILE